MIAKLTLSPFAIEELSTLGTASVVRSLNRTLSETLMAHGSLYLANASDKEQLKALLKGSSELPPRELAAWKEAILVLAGQGRLNLGRPALPCGISEISSQDQLAAVAASHPECLIYVLTEAQLDILFPQRNESAEPKASRYVSGVTLHEAEPISVMAAAARRGNFPTGSDRNGYWDLVLAPLSASAKNITILDQYIFRGMKKWSVNRPAADRWDKDVLTWLLYNLDTIDGPDVEVDICAGTGRPGLPNTPADALTLLQQSWKPLDDTRIKAVNLFVGEWEPPGAWLPHDRHIRFGSVSIVAFPQGLDRLGRRKVQDLDGVNWIYKWDAGQCQSLRDAESRVRSAHPKITLRTA